MLQSLSRVKIFILYAIIDDSKFLMLKIFDECIYVTITIKTRHMTIMLEIFPRSSVTLASISHLPVCFVITDEFVLWEQGTVAC